jgi:PAS domain S-box-containing protein
MSALSVNFQVYWFKIRVNPVYHADGKLIGVTVVSEYITDQKKAENYLAESEARFRSILHAMPMPIIVLDEQCEITGINPYAQRMLRRTEQNVLGTSIDGLIPPNCREDLLMSSWDSLLSHLTDPGITHEVMEIYLHPTNKLAFFEVYANDFEFRDKKQTVVIFSDITNHIESSRVIQKHLDTLREVAYVQSHVIRSPLAKILGISNLLQNEPFISAEEYQTWLTHLTESAEELDTVIQELVNRVGR